MTDRPINVLYIHSHDTGRYVEPYGYKVPTPRIQKLAEEGVLFRQAFCVNPTCSPSRAALLTGRYPHQNGMIGLTHRGARLHEPRQHLASILRAAGYETALFGVQHEASDPRELGYEEVHTSSEVHHPRPDDHFAGLAADFLRRPHDRPFFLAVGFYATHRTAHTPEGVQWHNSAASPCGDPRYIRPPAPIPDTPDTRRDFADYIVSAQRLDDCIATVLDALERAGLSENTLVICTTDHGLAFPAMKCHLTDHGLGVMLILRGPGGFNATTGGAGRVVDAMVTHLDVLPTIRDLTGVAVGDGLAGKSLLPLVREDVDELHDAIFAGVNYHAAYEPMRAVRTRRFKYIRRFDPRPGPVLPNIDDGVSKDMLLEHGLAQREPAMEQLYDLVFDPNESHNLAAGEPNREVLEVLERMRRTLDAWMRETDDPLQAGWVEPYPNMVITQADARGPTGPKLPADWRPLQRT